MRDEKQLLLDEIKEKIEESQGFVIAGYKNFSAVKSREFRNLMSEVNADFEVVRKRVFVKAAEAVGIKLIADDYEGHIGVLFAYEDATKASKAAVKFGEENENAIVMLGGRIDGQVVSGEDVVAIAKLPGLSEMRSEFLGLLEAPMAQTLCAMNALLCSIPYCLDEKAKKSSE